MVRSEEVHADPILNERSKIELSYDQSFKWKLDRMVVFDNQNASPANLAPFVAKEMGIFAKHGLDVDLSLIDGGSPSAAALIAGQVQFANFGGTETMSGVAAGSDMVAIALFVPVTPWQLLAKTDYKQPSDLKGKAVGIATKGGSSEVALNLSLQKLGLARATDLDGGFQGLLTLQPQGSVV